MNDRISIGVIGCGYWGPNHVRVFSQLKESQVVALADTNKQRVSSVMERFPGVRGFTDYHEMLDEKMVDAVVVATPTHSHDVVVEDALNAGRHVLCEKPLCINATDGEKLVALARERGRILMVGHVFLFNSGIIKLKELMAAGEIGEARYLAAVRTNLGPVRSDVNAAYDLASHDIGIFNWLLDSEPLEVRAMGAAFLQPGIEDVVVITLRYPGNVLASIQCSWLDPRKVRLITVVGSQRMMTWDDLALANPVAIYEKSVIPEKEVTDYGEFLRLSPVDGEVRLPRVATDEPLKTQALSFLRSIRQGRVETSGGEFALGVVRVLQQVAGSLHGAPAVRKPALAPGTPHRPGPSQVSR